MHIWKEGHLSFLNADVPELLAVDHSEEHATLVLVEPFLHPHTFEHESRRASRKQCARGYLVFVNMVVISLVRPADDHDGEVLARVDAVVVYGRLEEMRVFGEPGGGLFGLVVGVRGGMWVGVYHLGMLRGGARRRVGGVREKKRAVGLCWERGAAREKSVGERRRVVGRREAMLVYD